MNILHCDEPGLHHLVGQMIFPCLKLKKIHNMQFVDHDEGISLKGILTC